MFVATNANGWSDNDCATHTERDSVAIWTEQLCRQLDAVRQALHAYSAESRAEWGAARSPAADLMEATGTNVCEGMPFWPAEIQWNWLRKDAVRNARVYQAWRLQRQTWMPRLWGTLQAIRASRRWDWPATSKAWIDELRSWHDWVLGEEGDPRAGQIRCEPVWVRSVYGTFSAPPAPAVPELLHWLHGYLTNIGDPWERGLLAELGVVTLHPFHDGNGRVSRLAGNAGRERRRIPCSLGHDEYVRGLTRLQNTVAKPGVWLDEIVLRERESYRINGMSVARAIVDWSSMSHDTIWDLFTLQTRPKLAQAGPDLPPRMIERYDNRRNVRATEWGLR